jgi:RHS repeat-associated protein
MPLIKECQYLALTPFWTPDANGNPLNPNCTAYNNRFLFTGREYGATYPQIYVSTFSFYEYRARAYNPTLGRFMSEDPKLFDAGDYNLFRYCHIDPIDMTDSMGLETDYAQTGAPVSGNHVATEITASQAVWQRQMDFYMGAISTGIRAYMAEQAFKVSVGIEATKRAEAATGRRSRRDRS